MLPLFLTLYVTCVGGLAESDVKDFPQNLARTYAKAGRSIRSVAETPVCKTEECQTIASIFKLSMNATADPCEDLRIRVWRMGQNCSIRFQTALFCRGSDFTCLLEEDVTPHDMRAVKLMKRYYRTCTNKEQIERDGLEPLIVTLSRAGGWPMVMEPGEWNEDIYRWQNVDDYYARLTGENAFHKITVEHSENASTLSVTYRDLPEGSNRLSLHRISQIVDMQKKSSEQDNDEPSSNYYIDSEQYKDEIRNYVNLIIEIAMAIAEVRGITISKEQFNQDISDMIVFMVELQITVIAPIIKDHMSLLELHQWYNTFHPVYEIDKVNWLNKIMLLFDELGIDINEDTYFENLRDLLNRTPHRTIVNYIHWQFISDAIKATTQRMRELHLEMISTSNSYKSMVYMKASKYSKCISEIKMFNVLCYLYTKRYSSETIVNEANKMISVLKKQVEINILQSKWMDETSKNKALEVIRSMTEITEPSLCRNKTAVENYLKGLTVGPSYFENLLSSKRYNKRMELWTLKEKIPKLPEEENPFKFDASYTPGLNRMRLTPADFQSPFFSLSRPSIINYGIIGIVIAHEINHAFHSAKQSSIHAGQKGLFSTVNDAYQKRVQCFVDQFNNYTSEDFGTIVEITTTIQNKITRILEILSFHICTTELEKQCVQIKIELAVYSFVKSLLLLYFQIEIGTVIQNKSYGDISRDENIADTMGLETTLAGYYSNRKEEDNVPVQNLPGLENFTAEQLFYLSVALMYCDARKIDDELIRVYAAFGYSTSRLRVIGSISNSKNFGKSFNCPVGSPMNPKTKCNIWS